MKLPWGTPLTAPEDEASSARAKEIDTNSEAIKREARRVQRAADDVAPLFIDFLAKVRERHAGSD